MELNITLGSFPGLTHVAALAAAQVAPGLSARHVQLCPQNHGRLDEATLGHLKASAPGSRLRFHANVSVHREFRCVEASTDWSVARPFFRRLADLNNQLDGQPYTLHAGERADGTLDDVRGNVRRIEDLMQVRVGVEGLYPVAGGKYLLDSWADYRWLLASGLDFALDLSHLNIVAHQSGLIEASLVQDLLGSVHCIEVHLSANDGRSDLHSAFDPDHHAWWHPLLAGVQPSAVAFYEGNEVRQPLNRQAVAQRVAAAGQREQLLRRA